MTTRERALRDLADYWHDFREGRIPLRDLCAGRAPTGRTGSAHSPAWFAASMRRRWKASEIATLNNAAWATARGHVDSYLTLLREVAEAGEPPPGVGPLQAAKRLIWRNQKRRLRAWQKSRAYLVRGDKRA